VEGIVNVSVQSFVKGVYPYVHVQGLGCSTLNMGSSCHLPIADDRGIFYIVNKGYVPSISLKFSLRRCIPSGVLDSLLIFPFIDLYMPASTS
jgi:hypothetical protein